MPRLCLLPLAVAALVLTLAAGARADTPKPGALYHDGPTGRYLLAGPWVFSHSRTGAGRVVSVPYAWNATDASTASFRGGIGYFRKTFTLPSSAGGLSWIVRFESVNYRSRVWLNGHVIANHAGAYLPFEILLPAKFLHRTGANHLIVRVDSVRTATDLPPSTVSSLGKLTGGWWNYSGILREVYLRRVNGVDIPFVQVQPHVTCTTCAAKVRVIAYVHNVTRTAHPVHATVNFGGLVASLGTATMRPGTTRKLTRVLTIAHPRLWAPGSPNLYDVTVSASGGGHASFVLRTGIRSLRVSHGLLLLNNRPVDLRGVGIHEDSLAKGSAIDDSVREQQLQWAVQLGADVIRSHYPLHPYYYERADQLGILVWDEIPVYGIKSQFIGTRAVGRAAAAMLRENILVNGSHPSVSVWSIANELSSKPNSAQWRYISHQVRLAHALDPTRPVGLAVAGYPSAGCQSAYGPLQVLGLNDYFGWYPGPSGQIADRTLTSAYLDQAHHCYPSKALFVTEYGAEADRDGPAEERGTYQFQQDYVNYQLGVFATKPWLNGAIYWALQEFRVRPGWNGGNPHPNPPLHEKGLVTFEGRLKPAFFDVQRWYKATPALR